MAEINLTREQRALMATEIAHKAGHRIEEFDWASTTVADDVVLLHRDLAPYVDLIRQLQSKGPVEDCELLRSCAAEVRDDRDDSVRDELERLERLLAGEWDYTQPDTPEERAKIESQTRRIIASDRATVLIMEGVLQALERAVA